MSEHEDFIERLEAADLAPVSVTSQPHALTREEVEYKIQTIFEAGTAALPHGSDLLAHDAALRQALAQQAQELERVKSEKNNAVIELYRKLDAKDTELAAMTAERGKATALANDMTCEAVACLMEMMELDYQLAASKARVRELENKLTVHTDQYAVPLEWSNGNRTERGFITSPEHAVAIKAAMAENATLQATLAAREARIAELEQAAQRSAILGAAVSDEAGWEAAKRFEALYDIARQDAARLREALTMTLNELRGIASANVKEWDTPTDAEFKAWAQNRARHTHEQAHRALKGA